MAEGEQELQLDRLLFSVKGVDHPKVGAFAERIDPGQVPKEGWLRDVLAVTRHGS